LKINFGAINKLAKRVEMLEEYIVPKYEYCGTRGKSAYRKCYKRMEGRIPV